MWAIYFAVVGVSLGFRTYVIGDSCGGRAGYVIHEVDKNRYDRRCCKQITCPAGERPVVCSEEDEDSTRCVPCEQDWYSAAESTSGSYFRCNPKTKCEEGKRVENVNDPKSDVTCLDCDLENGYFSDGVIGCFRTRCSEGTQLTLQGECEECLHGYFKGEPGYSQCKKWTECSKYGMKELQSGSRYKDVICSSLEGVSSESANVVDEPNLQHLLKTDAPAGDNHTFPSVAKAEDKKEESDSGTLYYVIGALAAITVIVIGILITCFLKRRKRQANVNDIESSKDIDSSESADVRTMEGYIDGNADRENLLNSSNVSTNEGVVSDESFEGKTEKENLLKSASEQGHMAPEGRDDDSGVGTDSSTNNLNEQSGSTNNASTSNLTLNIATERKQTSSTAGNFTDARYTNHEGPNITERDAEVSLIDNTVQSVVSMPNTTALNSSAMNIPNEEENSITDNTQQGNSIASFRDVPQGGAIQQCSKSSDAIKNSSQIRSTRHDTNSKHRIEASHLNRNTDDGLSSQKPSFQEKSLNSYSKQQSESYPQMCSQPHPEKPCPLISTSQPFASVHGDICAQKCPRCETVKDDDTNWPGDDYKCHLSDEDGTAKYSPPSPEKQTSFKNEVPERSGVVIQHIYNGDTYINENGNKTITVNSPSNVQIGNNNKVKENGISV